MRVEGTHREVGVQVGTATAAVVRRHAGAVDPERLAQAVGYRDATAAELPWLVEELDGVAEGAGADPLAVFAASIEEIWADAAVPAGRCSDLVGCSPATADGHVWVGHNNDLEPESEDELIALEWRVAGDPVSFTIGVGPWISVGFNSAGLALTGNELSPSDDRVGIPRLLLVRDILRRRTLEQAVSAALHPRRASSYNNLLSHRDGGVVSVEGSATDAELLRPRGRHARPHQPLHERQDGPVRARSGRDGRLADPAAVGVRLARAGAGHARTPARRALRPHRRSGLALPAHRGRRGHEDCLLVHRRRHRRDGPLRSRQSLRFAGAALRLHLSHPPTATQS